MSVLIKGMEMPKNCLTCKLRGDGSDSKYVWDCPLTGLEYTREEGETRRLDDCPLVEVSTPHGDLIDRQTAINTLCSKCTVDKPETCSTIQKGDNWCEEVYTLQRVPSAQPELIAQGAYVRGFEQGRTQGMIDSQGGKK